MDNVVESLVGYYDTNTVISPEIAVVPSPVVKNIEARVLGAETQVTTPQIIYVQGPAGPQGPQGLPGRNGSSGGGGSYVDLSNYISQAEFNNQIDRILSSIEGSSDNLGSSIANKLDTAILAVTGNGTIGGNLTVTGSITGNISGIEFDNTDFNTKVGYQAGENIATGAQYNTFVGYQAGFSNAISSDEWADENTALGYRALYSNTDGYSNVANGFQSLYSNTSGHSNAVNGYQTMYSNTTGYYNVANGYQSLYFNTTGDSNTASGYKALYKNTNGSSNSAYGDYSLYNNTSGTYNAGFGTSTLIGNTTGYRNTASGYNALNGNTSGYDNAGFGSAALFGNTTGYSNSGLGYQAGRYIANGSTANQTSNTSLYLGANTKSLASGDTNEIVIGYNVTGLGSNTAILGNSSITATSLNGVVTLNTPLATDAAIIFKNATVETARLKTGGNNVLLGKDVAAGGSFNFTTSTENVALGTNALFSATTGVNYNIAIGKNALYSNDSDQNIGIGYQAGYFLDGVENVLIGGSAGYGIAGASGSDNVIIGELTAQKLSSGSTNVFIGYQTAWGDAGGISGGENIALGYGAMNDISTAYGNAAIGSGALHETTTGQYNMAFGYQAGWNITTGDRNIMIGYDTNPSAATIDDELNIGKTIYGNLASKYIGINCTAPDHILELGGTGAGCNTGVGSWIAAGDTAFTANSSREWKDNIKTYETSDILERIMNTPVRTYDWKSEYCEGEECQNKLGFIAEEFYGVLERGDGLHVNGQDVMMAEWLGIQQLNLNLEGIAGTIVPLEDSENESFVNAFFENMFSKIKDWLGGEGNGVEKLCINNTCVTEDQLKALLEDADIDSPVSETETEPVVEEPVSEGETVSEPESSPEESTTETISEPEPEVIEPETSPETTLEPEPIPETSGI